MVEGPAQRATCAGDLSETPPPMGVSRPVRLHGAFRLFGPFLRSVGLGVRHVIWKETHGAA